jgi:hypothetical protein
LQETNQSVSKKASDIQRLINKINDEWQEKNKRPKFAGNVNFLLRSEENIEITQQGEKLKLTVHFTGGDSYVEIDVEGD